jgi:hypothetical protein
MTHAWFMRGLFGSIVLLCALGAGARADEVEDFDAFVAQYALIRDLNISSQGTRAMTVSSYGITEEAVAQGAALFYYSWSDELNEGMVRVEADLVAVNESGVVLEQRLKYAFDGETHSMYDPELNVHETRSMMILAGAEVPVNPALYPVSGLRPDMVGLIVKHPGDFADTARVQRGIVSKSLVRDEEGELCVELRLDEPKREGESDPAELDRRYRYYMTASHPDAGFALPARVDMMERGALAGTVTLGEYTGVETGRGVVVLPKRVSLVVWENEVPIVEYSAYVDRYTTTAHERAFFRIEAPRGARIVDGDAGTMIDDAGTARGMPIVEPGVTERYESEADGGSSGGTRPVRTYGLLVVLVIGAGVALGVGVWMVRRRG